MQHAEGFITERPASAQALLTCAQALLTCAQALLTSAQALLTFHTCAPKSTVVAI